MAIVSPTLAQKTCPFLPSAARTFERCSRDAHMNRPITAQQPSVGIILIPHCTRAVPSPTYCCPMREKGADYKKLIISRQLDKKKDLIRALFRACGNRTVGERFQSREIIRPPVAEYDPSSAEKTIFEKIDTVSRPALYPMEKKKIKWKKRTRRSSSTRRSKRSRRSRRGQKSHRASRDSPERRSVSAKIGTEVQDTPSLAEAVTHHDFAIAYKVMGFVKEHGMLENILNEEDTEKVRQFFETELSRPSYRVSVKVMRLLHEAFNKCWERIMDEFEKFGFDQETGLFLSEMEKAKASFLDVMLVFPEYIPESWGGRHIVEISLPCTKGLHLSTDMATTSHLTGSGERTSRVSQISQASHMYHISQAAEERREKVTYTR
ncbi:hypothetical protein Y032_0036g3202 [Ancylostoma ceylanicum]|uniref:DUF7774 domain-containing protein n=1 Tax=Ancylostoma ceylanicum TaxID=53326 RepID=A0A016UM34_9BILA|nr:hypothetical protein Y032_0036g3202 [Ancylostoma ceylanicum]